MGDALHRRLPGAVRTHLAVGLVALLAGCAAVADPMAGPSRVERYLQHVHASVPWTRTVSDEVLVRLGLADCVLLRNGTTLESLLGLAPAGMGKPAARRVVATSVAELCPELRDVPGAGSLGVRT